MTLLVQDFLAEHSLADLRERHGVKHRWSARRSGVLTLNYDQLEVCDTDPLSQECRGLILRAHHPMVWATPDGASGYALDAPVGHTSIVARPFARFFNHGTGPCADVDFGCARFYEKLDGTLCIVHHDEGEWHVATRSVPDADVPIDGSAETFRGLFERALRECGEAAGLATTLGEGLHPERTYLFELCAPENQIVVRYEERSVVLLGIRDRDTGEEYPPETLGDLYLVCPSHDVADGALPPWVHDRDPMRHEGLVVCDHAFRRCKVKSAGYVALARTKDSVGRSDRRMLELVLLGRDAGARPLLAPHILARLDAIKEAVGAYLARVDADYERLHAPDRKAFALRIQAEGAWMAALMARYSGKCADARGFVEAQRREGTWPDALLDSLLEGAGVAQGEER
jgi:hypothetical protein